MDEKEISRMDIHITEEMFEAGSRELFRFDPESDEYRDALREIYRKMRLAEQRDLASRNLGSVQIVGTRTPCPP